MKVCVCENVTSQLSSDTKRYRSYYRKRRLIFRVSVYSVFVLWLVLLVHCHVGGHHVVNRIVQSARSLIGYSNPTQLLIGREVSLKQNNAYSDVTWEPRLKSGDVTKQRLQTDDVTKQRLPTGDVTNRRLAIDDVTKRILPTGDVTKRRIATSDVTKRTIAANDVTKRILPANYKKPTPPNPNFIFHNKLPKSGSSTMNNILKKLSTKNKFNYLKAESGVIPLNDELPLVRFLKKKKKKPFFLLKHHYWMDFTRHGGEQPTFINVIRDPVEWFISRYYFSRFGWRRKPGCRDAACSMDAKEYNMTIDQCVQTRHPHCVTSQWLYLPYFCGSSKYCIEMSNATMKDESMEAAMRHLVEDYHVVGILEQFEDSLKLFEKLLPRYFNDVMEVWRNRDVQYIQEVTKTLNRKSVKPETRHFLENGPLKQEVTFYKFARKLFNEQLTAMDIVTSTQL